MRASSFSEIEREFLHSTSKIVLCTLTTVSPDGQPRSRMLHKQHVWDLFMGTPPPVGYDLTSYGSPRSSTFTPLRLDPSRVQVVPGREYPFGNLAGRVWTRAEPRRRAGPG